MAQVAAVGLVAAPALILGWLAVRAVRRRSGRDLPIIAVIASSVGLGLVADYGASHLYFRPRPYWVVSSVQALLPRDDQVGRGPVVSVHLDDLARVDRFVEIPGPDNQPIAYNSLHLRHRLRGIAIVHRLGRRVAMEPIAIYLSQQDLTRRARSALPDAPVVADVAPAWRVRGAGMAAGLARVVRAASGTTHRRGVVGSGQLGARRAVRVEP